MTELLYLEGPQYADYYLGLALAEYIDEIIMDGVIGRDPIAEAMEFSSRTKFFEDPEKNLYGIYAGPDRGLFLLRVFYDQQIWSFQADSGYKQGFDLPEIFDRLYTLPHEIGDMDDMVGSFVKFHHRVLPNTIVVIFLEDPEGRM